MFFTKTAVNEFLENAEKQLKKVLAECTEKTEIRERRFHKLEEELANIINPTMYQHLRDIRDIDRRLGDIQLQAEARLKLLDEQVQQYRDAIEYHRLAAQTLKQAEILLLQ